MFCELNNCDFSFNFVIEMAISAFFGFGSALLVEATVAFFRSRKCKNQLLNDLVKELKTIEVSILNLKDNQVYIKPYSIPVWEGACSSGSVLSLDKHVCYLKIIQAFASVMESNLIEKACFELVVANNDDANYSMIMETLKKNRKQLLEQIRYVINYIKEECSNVLWNSTT